MGIDLKIDAETPSADKFSNSKKFADEILGFPFCSH
jgi:hypothetical protein